MVSRHEFLAQLHELLKPKTYLEVGVQFGTSLSLAHASKRAIGIDPNPQVHPNDVRSNMIIHAMQSSTFFIHAQLQAQPLDIDLAFIDGSHLFEDALRDFINIERWSGRRTVIVFDDVLPYNDAIANRIQPPAGDWTGDVWKIRPVLDEYMAEDTKMYLANTSPTGTFVVYNLPRDPFYMTRLKQEYFDLVATWSQDLPVPDDVLDRRFASEPQEIIDRLREDLCSSQ